MFAILKGLSAFVHYRPGFNKINGVLAGFPVAMITKYFEIMIE